MSAPVQTDVPRALAGPRVGASGRLAAVAALALVTPCMADPVGVPSPAGLPVQPGAAFRLGLGEERTGSRFFGASRTVPVALGPLASGSIPGMLVIPTLPGVIPLAWSEMLPGALHVESISAGDLLHDLTGTIAGSTPGVVSGGTHPHGGGDALAPSVIVPLPPAAAIGAAGLLGVIAVQRLRRRS